MALHYRQRSVWTVHKRRIRALSRNSVLPHLKVAIHGRKNIVKRNAGHNIECKIKLHLSWRWRAWLSTHSTDNFSCITPESTKYNTL